MTLIVADLLRAGFRSSTVLLFGYPFGVVVFIGSGAVWAKAFVKRYSAVTSTAANGAKVSRSRRSSARSLSNSAFGLADDIRSAALRILGAAEDRY